jgi:hypothetical protein
VRLLVAIVVKTADGIRNVMVVIGDGELRPMLGSLSTRLGP